MCPKRNTPLRIGLVGYGFMGRAHANAYRQVNAFFDLKYQPRLVACAARNAGNIQSFADNWGFESYETDWRRLIERDDIDAIDICTPNNTHCEIACAAAAAGKMVLCEKPLAMNVAEGMEILAAVEQASVANMIWFNYRRVPAIALAKQLVDEGRIGKSYHYRATYNQDWTMAADVPQGGPATWRLDAAAAGSGVTGDLLAHSIDTAEWLNGPIKKVVAKTQTFIKKRTHAESGRVEPVEIDDACMFLAVFDNGAMGTFESTRYARGRKNYNTFELNGEDGSVYFDLEDHQYLQFFEYTNKTTGEKVDDHTTGWRKIHVTNFEHPYMDRWWVPGCTVGYEHTFINALADFLHGLETGQPAQPDIRSGLRTQLVCDAVLASADSGEWVTI